MTPEESIPAELRDFVRALEPDGSAPERLEDGTISIGAQCMLRSPAIPHFFSNIETEQIEVFDDSGNGVETEDRWTYCNEKLLAILSVFEHPIAGVFVELRIFRTLVTFRAGLPQARLDHA